MRIFFLKKTTEIQSFFSLQKWHFNDDDDDDDDDNDDDDFDNPPMLVQTCQWAGV